MKISISLVSAIALTLFPPGKATSIPEIPENYDIDPVHSFAVFKIKHLNLGYVWGRINSPMGSIVLDGADPTKSSVTLGLKAENVDTNNKERDKHLRSPDFFNAEKFPTISFKSTSIRKTGENDYEVAGTFTLLGKAKEIVIRLRLIGSGKDAWGNFRTGFDGDFTIKRSEFGMTHMLDSIGDEVLIYVSVEGVRKGAQSSE
jgi:polyisoprenoid-binding protein YceI